ncbi:MAG: adenylyl-sulfate kinase [Alphaproteobacteria bacterium]|nr:adenylyl-sulfate kinase [Alphaproteobacteria bacterium]
MNISTEKDSLIFVICGSVDDGKSTLLGRLLHDCKAILTDQLATAKYESSKYGTQGGELDMALLIDGLQAEREQGITIDVAYRYFETDRRKFIATDTPGHIQYTRNMATAASQADLAIILVDARKGMLEQTCRHSYICALMGVKHILLAVNKMDMVDDTQKIFTDIVNDYQQFKEKLVKNIGHDIPFGAIPISALYGKNIVSCDTEIFNWYDGDSLLDFLHNINFVDEDSSEFILPVQLVNRPNSEFRGYSGQVAQGSISSGDKIVILPSGQKSYVETLLTPKGVVQEIATPQAVTLTIRDNIDVSRGSVITTPNHNINYSDQFSAHFLAMHDAPIHAGRDYLLRTRNQLLDAHITNIRYVIDVNNFAHLAQTHLQMNNIAVCQFKTSRSILFTDYQRNKMLGSFLLIDKVSNATLGAGMIDFALRRGDNIFWHDMKIDKAVRSQQKQQKPCILWFTGLSASGKSTIADRVEQQLQKINCHTYLLDGDNVRHGLNQDLGFTDTDRIENIRRVAEVSKLMLDAGLIILVSFISPFRSERALARKLVQADEFIEIYVNTPLEICEKRDPKGLYQKARAGALQNFSGIDSPYEAPQKPDITLDTQAHDVTQLTMQVIDYLKKHGYLDR